MITSAEEYKQALLNIQQGSIVVHTTLPSTEPRIPIDLDTRNINVPDEFKFLATKKETKAETIYFICDRYFDDIDLSTKTCVVQYVNTDGKTTNRGLYPVTEIDVDSIDGKIIFGWQIQSESTQLAGKIEFAISFYEIGEDETGINEFKYNLTTLATSSLILDTLDVWKITTTPITTPSEFQIWLNKINTIAQEANSNNNETKAKIKEFDDNFNGKIRDINTTAISQIEAINNTAQSQIGDIENHGNDILDNLGIVNNAKLHTDIYFDCQSYNRFMITSFTIDGNDVIKNGKGTVYVTKLKADGSTIVDKKIILPTDCAFNTEINIGNCAKIKIELGCYDGTTSTTSASFTYALYSDYSDVTNKCDETINTLNNLAYLSIAETEDVVDEPIDFATKSYVLEQIQLLREELKN